MQTTLDLIAKDYYRRVDTGKLLNTGLEAAVASLNDPYSHYFPPVLYKSFQQETNPQVAGIGVEVAVEPVHGGIEVEEVIQGSPAARAGLRHGCRITAVGSTSLSGKTVAAGSKLIKGDPCTEGGSRFSATENRATLTITRGQRDRAGGLLEAHQVPRQAIGYLVLSHFADGAADELRQQVQAMQKAPTRRR